MNELQRLIQNLIRVGVVAEVDRARPGCRVTTGGLTTDWLPWLVPRAGESREWSAPSVGEQVLLLAVGGELGTAFVLPGLYSDAHPAPSDSADAQVTVFPDGARFEYEPASGRLLITGVKNIAINADAIDINSAVTINGPVTHTGGNMTSNGVVVHTHQHSGVLPGGSNTGGPV